MTQSAPPPPTPTGPKDDPSVDESDQLDLDAVQARLAEHARASTRAAALRRAAEEAAAEQTEHRLVAEEAAERAATAREAAEALSPEAVAARAKAALLNPADPGLRNPLGLQGAGISV